MDKLSKIDRRRLLGFATLLFILVAIPLTIYLVRQQQILKGRAYGENSSLNFISGPGGGVISQRNSSEGPNVWLRLIWASGGTNPSPSPSPSASPGTIAPNCQVLFDKIAASFGTFCGESGYDKIADIDNDRDVDIFDNSLVNSNKQNNTMCTNWLNDQTNPCTSTPTPSPSPSPPTTTTACSTGVDSHGCTICGPNSNLVQGQLYQYTLSPTFDCTEPGTPAYNVNDTCVVFGGRIDSPTTSTNKINFVADKSGTNRITFYHHFLGTSSTGTEICALNVQVSNLKLPSAQCTKAAADIDGDGVVTSGLCSDRPASDTTLAYSCALFSFQAGWSFANPPTGLSSEMINGCKELDLNNNGYLEQYELDCVTEKVEKEYSQSYNQATSSYVCTVTNR